MLQCECTPFKNVEPCKRQNKLTITYRVCVVRKRRSFIGIVTFWHIRARTHSHICVEEFSNACFSFTLSLSLLILSAPAVFHLRVLFGVVVVVVFFSGYMQKQNQDTTPNCNPLHSSAEKWHRQSDWVCVKRSIQFSWSLTKLLVHKSKQTFAFFLVSSSRWKINKLIDEK